MLKVWNGSIWKPANGIKVYTGTEWRNDYKLRTRSGNVWLPASVSNLDASITLTYSVVAPTIPGGGPTATVPNLNGLTLQAAITALENLNLIDSATEQVTNTQNLDNYVVNNSQSPAAGTVVAQDSTVTFKYYNYIPAKTTVPNIVGLTTASADASITNAELIKGFTSTFETTNTNLIGTVKSQSPAAGTQVDVGDDVSYEYYIEDTDRTVPQLNNLTRAQAQNALAAVNLFYTETAVETTNTNLVGYVVANSQTPSAGSIVQKNSYVDFDYYTLANVTVPDVTNDTITNARTEIANAGLTISEQTTANSNPANDNKVYFQSPSAGSSVPSGSTITVYYYLPAPLTTVPNIVGSSRSAAQTALTNLGLTYAESTIETTDASLYSTNIVQSQTPAAGSTVNPGSQIAFTYYIQKVLVPVTITETITLDASWTASYNGSGSQRSTNADMYHGQFDSTRGNQKSMWSWDWSYIIGKAQWNITAASITWYQAHTYIDGSGCTMQIGTHDNQTAPSTWGSANTGLQTRAVVRNNSYTVTLNSTIRANLNGSAWGITFGPAANTTQANYGYVTGSGASRPSITITFTHVVYQ
jgi:beta-lactam-binding protein with PASTA domain